MDVPINPIHREAIMRRTILALAAAALAISLPASSAPGGTITLSYANFPPAKTFPCVQMERWKKEVEKRTDGLVRVNTYPGGTLLGAKNMFRGVKQGRADIGCLCMAYQPGVFPLTSVMELPHGFRSAEGASRTLLRVMREHDPEAFSEVKVLTVFTSAPSNIMSKVPVRGLQDLQGVELRASGTASRILELLGATPVSMPMSETPEALQKGVVQGLLSSLEVLKDLNFAAYCPYQTITNLQVYPFAVVMNRGKWESLPESVQQVFNELRREQCVWTGRYLDRHVREALRYARTEHDTQVFRLDDRERERMRQQIGPVVEEWQERAREAGLEAERIIGHVREIRAELEEQGGE
jgi:TRAP-type C4-dicarboxylate transport system substrate-binding protein